MGSSVHCVFGNCNLGFSDDEHARCTAIPATRKTLNALPPALKTWKVHSYKRKSAFWGLLSYLLLLNGICMTCTTAVPALELPLADTMAALKLSSTSLLTSETENIIAPNSQAWRGRRAAASKPLDSLPRVDNGEMSESEREASNVNKRQRVKGRANGVGGNASANLWRRPILVGTHHKTGTLLLAKVFRVAAKVMGVPRHHANKSACDASFARQEPSVCIDEHVSAKSLSMWRGGESAGGKTAAEKAKTAAGLSAVESAAKNTAESAAESAGESALETAGGKAGRVTPFIHLVRDPLEMCVSAYQYHRLGTEPWLTQPRADLDNLTLQQYYLNISVADGVRFECKRIVSELVEEALVFNATKADADTLTVRYESISADFDTAMRSIFTFLGSGKHTAKLLDVARQFDLKRTAPGDPLHVSATDEKAPLRAILTEDGPISTLFAQLRALLLYTATEAPAVSKKAVCDTLSRVCETTQVHFFSWCVCGRVPKGALPSLPNCGAASMLKTAKGCRRRQHAAEANATPGGGALDSHP